MSPVTESILDNACERKEFKDKFPGVDYALENKKGELFCRLDGIPEDCLAAKDYIIKLPDKFGTVEIGLKDIRFVDKLRNKEGILQTLLKDLMQANPGVSCRLDNKNNKIYVVADNQGSADTFAKRIKQGILYKEGICFGNMKKAYYQEIISEIISKYFANTIEFDLDKESYTMKFVGLKTSVDTIYNELKPVRKTTRICTDAFDLILEKATQKSDGKVELIPI